MSKQPEMLDLWILRHKPHFGLPFNQVICAPLDTSAASFEPDNMASIQNLHGVHLTNLAASEQTKILNLIKAAGIYEVEVEHIFPQEPNCFPYTLIVAIDQLNGDPLTTLQNILILGRLLSQPLFLKS